MRCYLFLFTILLISCANQKSKPTFAENVVVAHRGAWKAKDLPQNSIASLREAIKLKCTGSEFDVRMTADDSLIVTHDAHYNNFDIEETNYSELVQLKLSNGEELPTLRNYILAGLSDNLHTRLVCELKSSKSVKRGELIAEKTMELVNKLNAQSMVIYISFDYEILKKLESLDSTVHTQYLKVNKTLENLKEDGINGIDFSLNSYKNNPNWISIAKKNKLILNVWTVNKSEDMDLYLKRDFNFITTDEPELLLSKGK